MRATGNELIAGFWKYDLSAECKTGSCRPVTERRTKTEIKNKRLRQPKNCEYCGALAWILDFLGGLI